VDRIERNLSARYEKLDAKFHRSTKRYQALTMLAFVMWIFLCCAVIFTTRLSRIADSSTQAESTPIYEQAILNFQLGAPSGLFSSIGSTFFILLVLIVLAVLTLAFVWIAVKMAITVVALSENENAKKSIRRTTPFALTFLSTIGVLAISTFQAGFTFEGEGYENLIATAVLVVAISVSTWCLGYDRKTRLWYAGLILWFVSIVTMLCFILFQPHFDFCGMSWTGRILFAVLWLFIFVSPFVIRVKPEKNLVRCMSRYFREL